MCAPTPTRLTDDPGVKLMLRVQRDEPGAFADLVREYTPQLLGRFMRQVRDRQEAEDLTQNVFLRLYRHRYRYRPTANFTTWLFHIARNAGRNVLRSRRRKPVTPVGEFVGSSAEAADVTRQPQTEIERLEATDLLHRAISQLADRQRVALELQFRDCSYNEIAAQLDMTPNAAKSLLYRTRNHLRECLQSHFQED